MIALVLSLALASFEHLPSDGGYPDVTLIASDAPTVSMLVSFGAGYGDDFGLTGLSAQSQTALTQANSALNLRKWNEFAFQGRVKLSLSLSRYQTHFVLDAPREVFEQAARMLLPALMSPRLDGALFAGLDGHASPSGTLASDSELMIQMLEPLILKDAKEVQRGKLTWHPFSRVNQHVTDFFTPGNAVITVVGGFDPAVVRPLTLAAHRGAPRVVRRPATATDVHRKIDSATSVHLFGYPLPELTPSQVAGMRLINRKLYETLIVTLREQGVAYWVTVEPQFNPWFTGLFIVVPAFDIGGTDLEPLLIEALSDVAHQRFDRATLEHLREATAIDDARALQAPASLTASLVSGRVSAQWFSPEFVEARDALTSESVQRISNELFVNERRRFYVRFAPAAPRKP